MLTLIVLAVLSLAAGIGVEFTLRDSAPLCFAFHSPMAGTACSGLTRQADSTECPFLQFLGDLARVCRPDDLWYGLNVKQAGISEFMTTEQAQGELCDCTVYKAKFDPARWDSSLAPALLGSRVQGCPNAGFLRKNCEAPTPYLGFWARPTIPCGDKSLAKLLKTLALPLPKPQDWAMLRNPCSGNAL